MNKKYILFICTVLYSNKIFSQEHIIQSSYGGDYEETVSAVIHNQFSDLIIIGASKSFPSASPIGIPEQFYVTKIDSTGNQNWGVVEGDLGELDLSFSAIKTYDNKYLAVGYASYQGTINQIPGDIRLLKIDEAGNTVYSKLIEYGGVTSAGRDICYTTDINYMIGGERIDSFEWKHYPLLTKINENGDVIWTKDYKQDTITSLYVIKQALNGGYFALGTNIVYSSNSVVMRYTEDGEVLWWKDLRDMGEGYDGIEMIYDMEVNSEGNIIIVVNGHFTSFNPFVCTNQPPEFAYLLEMNPDGEIINQKTFCSNQELPVLYYDLTITEDGGILLASYNMILKLNTDWETEWYLDNIFENGNNYKIKKVGQFEDNSFYGVGELIMGNNNTDYFIVRIPENGTNDITTIINKEDRLLIYPNPATYNITLEIRSTVYSPSSIVKVYDLRGQQVFETTNNKHQKLNIDVSGFAAGLYVIQLQSQQGIVSKKFVKE
jgi:hypothetical protein